MNGRCLSQGGALELTRGRSGKTTWEGTLPSHLLSASYLATVEIPFTIVARSPGANQTGD